MFSDLNNCTTSTSTSTSTSTAAATRRRLAHDTQSESESEAELCLVRGNGNGQREGGIVGWAGECIESGKGKGTVIRATGTIKRASKRNVYLPSLLAPSLPLSLPLYPLSLSLSLALLSFYMLMFSVCSVWGVLSHLSGAQAQLKKFLALAKLNLNILIALFNRNNNNSNTNNKYSKRY